MRILLFLLFTTAVTFGWGQVSLTTIGSPYTQDFNTLVNTGTSSVLPTGWSLNEVGGNATYAAGNGSDNTGNTYSFGATGTAERALGGLLSGSVTPSFGASFTNNTGSIITSIDLAYIGEQWRIGATGRVDRIDFQYSENATSLITGTWTDVNTLDFTAPTTTGTLGALNGNLAANRTAISSSITGLSIAIGATFWIRWTDLNASGSDDGLSVDDFSLTPFTTGSNTITTTTVATSPFVVTCNTAATGSVDFTSTGTFNPANVYTAQLSDELGDFTIPTNIGTLASTALNGTIPFSIPAGTFAGSLYRIRVISNDPLTIGTDNGIDLTITNNCIITTGTVSSSSFSVSCAAGTNGTIDFTSSSTMLGGNVYSAQLSDAAGSFIASTTIGTLSSTADNGTISFTIPATTTTGSNYLIRVIASNPSTTGNSSVPLTITLTDGPCAQVPPHLTSVIINSCDPTCDEGYNEIVFGTSGDYSFDVNTTNFDFLYGSTNPGTNYTDVLVNNTTGINQLNTAAGCPGLFIDAVGTTIPPNSSWVLVYRDICEEALTWSGLCGSGPIYVIFQNDANWSTTGNFANNPSAASPIRYFRTAITTTSGSTFTINYTTDGNQYPDNDGVYATFDANGGAATSYGDNNCILDPVLLPSDLVNFKGQIINSQSLLTWETSSEQNNDYFTISHSTTGYNFEAIGQVQGAGNATTLNNYNLTHDRPSSGINYYKLTSTDFDGTTYVKGIVSLLFNSNGCYFDAQTSEIKFNERSDYRIFSMDGKLLGEVMNESRLLFNQQGIVLIQDLRTGLTERLFVP